MLRFIIKTVLKNKQTRLILTLTLGVSLLILAIGLYSYSKYREVLDTELNTPNVELLQINLDVMNRAIRESDAKAVDLTFHSAVLKYINADTPVSAGEAEEPLSYLRTLTTGPDLHAISVMKFADRSLLSSADGFTADWREARDTGWTEWIGQIQDKPLLLKRRTLEDGRTPAGGTELLSLVRPILTNGKVSGAVMVDMDYDRLFSKMYTHLSSYQYVYDLEGALIYPKLNAPVPPSEMEGVLAEIDVRPFAYVTLGGQEYMANQTFSDVTGWRLVSLVPMEELLKNVKMARNMMLLISLISIAAGCAAIYYYNYAAFRPLKRINRLLNPEQAGGGNLHELEPVIGKLVGDFQSKARVAEWSLPELRSKFVQDLLARSLGALDMRTKWEHYFQDWKEGPFRVAVLSIDRYAQWSAAYREEDQMLLKYALNNIIMEKLGQSFRVVTATAELPGLAVLLQPKEANVSLRDELSALQGMLKELLHVSVSAGVGGEADGLQELPRSYAEAQAALSERVYAGYGHLRFYHEGLDSPGPASAQPGTEDSWRAEVVHAVKASDGGTAADWIAKWAAGCRKKAAAPQQVIRSAGELLEEMERYAAAGGYELPEELADYTSKQLLSMDLTEIEEMLIRIVHRLAEQSGQRRLTKEYQLVQAMIEYMNSHMHLNIGLQDVASHAGMGVSSVSTIFKEETGTTVYEYLTALRIEKASELLRDTPLKIADIAQQVGYQNENSFIRAFRKVKSITPGKYRETSKYSDEYADRPKPRRSGVSDDPK